MEIERKPCRKCGSKGRLIKLDLSNNYLMTCTSGECDQEEQSSFKNDVINEWNKRPSIWKDVSDDLHEIPENITILVKDRNETVVCCRKPVINVIGEKYTTAIVDKPFENMSVLLLLPLKWARLEDVKNA